MDHPIVKRVQAIANPCFSCGLARFLTRTAGNRLIKNFDQACSRFWLE
jgi:hypothetical protein